MATISGEVRDDAGDLVADVVVRAYRRDTGALLVSGLSGDGSEEVPGDADWDDVVLLLHFDGTDGSTTFTDSSGTPKTITAGGNAHIEADHVKYGDASGAFDGTGDYLTFNNPLLSHAGDFTIETFFRLAGTPTGDTYNTSYYLFSSGPNSSDAGCDFAIGSTKIWFNAYAYSTRTISASWTPDTGVWHHIALVRSGNVFTLYLDGTSIGTGTAAGTLTSNALAAISRCEPTGEATGYLNGYLDEYRITKDVARYTGGFTAPTAAFPADTIPAKPLGEYSLTTAYTGEVQVIALDPSGGTTFNDLILRTTPV